MGTLSIAFDTIIVGALALPWVFFAVDLFFLKNKTDDDRVKKAWKFVSGGVNPTVAGVLLFAATYLLGSAISRTAEDFFNDEDLIPTSLTEANIRTAEYCDQPREIRDTFSAIRPVDFVGLCSPTSAETPKRRICRHFFGKLCDKYSGDVDDIFRVQEGALLLTGEDKTDRLRQLHYQIVVLRGAAFDGLLAAAFCLFGWCAKKKAARQWFLGLVSGLFLVLGFFHLYGHIQRTGFEAPFAELTVFLLGVAGLGALSNAEDRRWYGVGLFVSLLLLTALIYFGWWSTEVLYNREVIYSFFAHSRGLVK
jgi:hypothetical protein